MLTGRFICRNRLSRVLISFHVAFAISLRITFGTARTNNKQETVGREREELGTLFPYGIRRSAQLFSSDYPANGNLLRHGETKSLISLSSESFERRREVKGRSKGRHTWERTLSKHAVSSVIDLVHRFPDLCPVHARRRVLSLLRETEEEIGFRFSAAKP